MERITAAELLDDFSQTDALRLVRHLRGELSPEEQIEVERWIAADPERQALVARIAAQWNAIPLRQPGTYDVETALLRAKRSFGSARSFEKHPLGLRTQTLRKWVPATAALAVFGAIAVGLMNQTANRPDQTAATSGARYVTATGQRAVVRLVDGTRVTLAPQTTLRLDPAFGTTSRTVVLSGEAYFEVTNGMRVPFIVQTGAATTRVLGTTFAVRRYPSDVGAHVAVVTGKVVVFANSTRRPTVTLTAGAVGLVTDSSAVTLAGEAAPHTAWVKGQLVFHRTPAIDVLAALTRWYGYKFRLADSALARHTLTVWISTESSREALATLKLMMDVDLSFDGMVVTLSPRRSAGHGTPARRDPQDIISPRIREVGR